jgi:hypothetical protein
MERLLHYSCAARRSMSRGSRVRAALSVFALLRLICYPTLSHLAHDSFTLHIRYLLDWDELSLPVTVTITPFHMASHEAVDVVGRRRRAGAVEGCRARRRCGAGAGGTFRLPGTLGYPYSGRSLFLFFQKLYLISLLSAYSWLRKPHSEQHDKIGKIWKI